MAFLLVVTIAIQRFEQALGSAVLLSCVVTCGYMWFEQDSTYGLIAMVISYYTHLGKL